MSHYGQAKIEFLKNIDEIKISLNKGLTRHQIYQDLKKQEKINFSDSFFYKLFKKHIPADLLKSEVERNFEKSQQADLEDYLEKDNLKEIKETTKEKKEEVSENSKTQSQNKEEETKAQALQKEPELKVSAFKRRPPDNSLSPMKQALERVVPKDML